MLIARHITTSLQDDSISVAATASGWRLAVESGAQPWAFEFDATLVVDRPDVAFLYLDRLGNPVLIWGSEIFHDRAATASALSRKRVAPGESSLAIFAVEADGTSHCFISAATAYVAGNPCEVDKSSGTAIEVLSNKVPSLRPVLRRALAKGRLLSCVSYADSIAALESQIDLLTSIVLELAGRLPESDRPALAGPLDEILSASGVFCLHTEEKLLGDLAAHKSKIRSLQSDYFAQRDGAV